MSPSTYERMAPQRPLPKFAVLGGIFLNLVENKIPALDGLRTAALSDGIGESRRDTSDAILHALMELLLLRALCIISWYTQTYRFNRMYHLLAMQVDHGSRECGATLTGKGSRPSERYHCAFHPVEGFGGTK